MKSKDESDNFRKSNEAHPIERRLEEVERRDFGGRWQSTWLETLERIPNEMRGLVATLALSFVTLAGMGYLKVPIPVIAATTILGLFAILRVSRASNDGKCRKENQTESGRSGSSEDQNRRIS